MGASHDPAGLSCPRKRISGVGHEFLPRFDWLALNGWNQRDVSSSSMMIYVYLLDENIDTWRPVEAEHLGGDRYRITSVNASPEDEHWQFNNGDVVRCSNRVLLAGLAVVAYERIEESA